ncbi:hypothetical protein BC936DRAFT_139026 [Jimgerdemannia flammicorona]|uniref:Uncharacterized protein n=1 Tax=Jimgerdemannia flammicorona TaxID=994334 RepID=A0A433DHW4_9FUNG|nr:hypothetical protein BC936DRAFT_139026 [Jimgerdemannia flammicorona]
MYEAATAAELKKMRFLKARGAVQTYQTGHDHLLKSSTLVSKINLRELRDVADEIKGGIEPTTPRKRKQESSYIGDITEDVIVDFDKYPILESYCRIFSALQEHHIDEDSQRARHSIAMLKRAQLAAVPVPRIGFKLVSAVLQEHFDDQLRSAAVILRALKRKGKLDSNDVSWMSPPAVIKQLFKALRYRCSHSSVGHCRCCPIHPYTMPWPRQHTIRKSHKAELWTKIFSAAFVLHCSKFIPVWELQHLIPGDGGCGSSRSDFAALVTNKNDTQFAFFLVEFENNGFEVHKDDVVAGAICQKMKSTEHGCISDLVNATKIHLSTLEPVFNQQDSTLIYVHDSRLSFDLQTKDAETNVESVLKLVTYLRETVCEDGLWIRSFLNRQPERFNYGLKLALPRLPREAVKYRPFDTKFTPQAKRQKYNILDK